MATALQYGQHVAVGFRDRDVRHRTQARERLGQSLGLLWFDRQAKRRELVLNLLLKLGGREGLNRH